MLYKNKCIHVVTKGNENYSIDFCDINDKICLGESNDICDNHETQEQIDADEGGD